MSSSYMNKLRGSNLGQEETKSKLSSQHSSVPDLSSKGLDDENPSTLLPPIARQPNREGMNSTDPSKTNARLKPNVAFNHRFNSSDQSKPREEGRNRLTANKWVT